MLMNLHRSEESHTSTRDAIGVVSDAPKVEIPTPSFPPIAISETPFIRLAKLENPLKKQRPSIRGYIFSLRFGGHQRGGPRHDQAGKPAIGKFAATYTKGMGEEWEFSLRGKRVKQILPELFTRWSYGSPVYKLGVVGDFYQPERGKGYPITTTLCSLRYLPTFTTPNSNLFILDGAVSLLFQVY